MASAASSYTLTTLCSSFSTHCKLSSSPSLLSLSKTPSLSLSTKPISLSSSLSLSARPAFPPPPKFSQTDAPPVESEAEAPAVEVEEGKGGEIRKDRPRPEDIFAVVMIGSRQYIVFPGRFLKVQRLKGANANDKIVLNKVLLVGTRTRTYIGKPVVTNAVIHAVVEEQLLDKKVVVFKYKKKKNYRRNIGHRQPITRIRIEAITGYEDYPYATLDQTKGP